jgi:hypothetical protein
MTFVTTQDDNCYCSNNASGGASKDLHHQQKGRHGGVAALDLHRLSGRDKLSIVVVTTVRSSSVTVIPVVCSTSAAAIVVKAT